MSNLQAYDDSDNDLDLLGYSSKLKLHYEIAEALPNVPYY